MAENENSVKMDTPCDIESERSVLGALLVNSEIKEDVFSILKPEDFYDKSHQELYKTFLEMDYKNIPIDLTTTNNALNQRKVMALVGGISYVAGLAESVVVSSNAKYYAEAVKAKSDMRVLIEQADLIKKKAYEGGESTDEILDFAEQRIFEIAHKHQKRNYTEITDVLQDNIKRIQEMQLNGGGTSGIPTNFRMLDRILGGLNKSDLIILAARPGMGKTSFALNIAESAAKAGNSVLIFSMEMSKEQIGQRMLAMSANVEMEKIKRGTIDTQEYMSIATVMDDYADYKLFIDDSSDISILEMKNKCRRLKAEKGLDLIIIDYLQLMSLGYNVDQRVNEISAITRNIKILAKELDCAVVLLSQLSRASEKRSDHRPILSDLRDSGSIEQDADVVLFLHRDDYYAKKDDQEVDVDAYEGKPAKTCDVIIAKHRNGATGTVSLAWIDKYTKFANLEINDWDF